jgi:hypothetical protein
MSADDLATALTQGGAGWLYLSLAAVLPILWAFTLMVHFGRPYVVRFLQSLTLRFGGDAVWLSYILMRDGLMLITLSLSMIFLMPNLYIGLGLPITAPLATVGLFAALVVKLTRDADDDPIAWRWVSIIMVVSSALYIVPQIYGLEAKDQVDRLSQFGLGWVPGALTAANPDAGTVNVAAWPILFVSLGLVAAMGAFLFYRFMSGVGSVQPAEATEQAPTGAPAA